MQSFKNIIGLSILLLVHNSSFATPIEIPSFHVKKKTRYFRPINTQKDFQRSEQQKHSLLDQIEKSLKLINGKEISEPKKEINQRIPISPKPKENISSKPGSCNSNIKEKYEAFKKTNPTITKKLQVQNKTTTNSSIIFSHANFNEALHKFEYLTSNVDQEINDFNKQLTQNFKTLKLISLRGEKEEAVNLLHSNNINDKERFSKLEQIQKNIKNLMYSFLKNIQIAFKENKSFYIENEQKERLLFIQSNIKQNDNDLEKIKKRIDLLDVKKNL